MLYKSKRCELQSKAREVLLTWARAGAYRDRAVRYLRLAHLASDRNVRNRFNAIARHYRELAEIERRVANGRVANERVPHNHQLQNTINRSHSRPRHPFAFVLLAIISGATTTVFFDLAHAGDCLPAPNSPAPKGSHWYYHLNRATQQKCWYVRSSETQQPQHATAQTTSADTAVPSTSAGQTDFSADRDIRGPSRPVETSTKAIQDPVSNTTPNNSASQIAPREDTIPPASQERTSSGPGVEATTPTAVVWPDPPPTAPAIKVREADAMPTDAALDPVSVSGNTDNAAPNGDRTSKFEIPIIVFPALAIGLVVIGFGTRLVRKAGAHRAQIVEGTEADTIADQGQDEWFNDRRAYSSTIEEHDLQPFVRAVSGHGPSEHTPAPVQTTSDISTRQARLAQLREDIDRRLRWSFLAEAQQQRQHVTSSARAEETGWGNDVDVPHDVPHSVGSYPKGPRNYPTMTSRDRASAARGQRRMTSEHPTTRVACEGSGPIAVACRTSLRRRNSNHVG